METGGVALECTLFYLQNDAAYTVRVYVRSPRGWQTSPNVKATATPRAGIPASSLAVGTLIRTTFDGVPYNHILVHKTSSYAAICPADRKINNVAFATSGVPRWQASSSRIYVNGLYKNRFDAKTQSAMLLSSISTYYNGNLDSTSDYVYFLSNREIGRAQEPSEGVAFDYFKTAANKKIPFNGKYPTVAGRMYFLRTASSDSQLRAHINVVDGGSDSFSSILCSESDIETSYLPLFNISPNTAFNPVPNADGSYNLL